MNNIDINQNYETNNDQVVNYVKTQNKHKRWAIAGVFIALVISTLGYFGYQNPELFSADIFNTESAPSGDVSNLYIPEYTAGIGEDGIIAIKSKTGIGETDSSTLVFVPDQIEGFVFTLNYEPGSLIFADSNVIAKVGGNPITSNDLAMASETTPGKLEVFAGLNDSIVINAPELGGTDYNSLVELNVKINPDLSVGKEIELSISGLSILIADSETPDMPNVVDGKIILEGQNNLKLLSVETIDKTHVVLHFSDLLKDNYGDADYYVVDSSSLTLGVSNIMRGNEYNTKYTQKDVVLETTLPQSANTQYFISVDGITGNSEGELMDEFKNAIFYGYGDDEGAMSDFNITSATATDYKTVVLNFSDTINIPSVNKDDFTFISHTGISIESAVASGNTVTLTVDENLTSNITYLIGLSTTGNILRITDNAELGINQVSFTGYKNGPRVESAIITQSDEVYMLNVTFDENIEDVIDDSAIANIEYEASTLNLSHSSTETDYQITDNVLLVVYDDFANIDTEFVFAATSNLKNEDAVSIDINYNEIIFNGFGSEIITNDVANKETFNVISAEAISPKEIRIGFSENIDSTTVEDTDFTLIGISMPDVDNVTVDTDFKHITLILNSELDDTLSVYSIKVEDVESYDGNKELSKNIAIFSRFMTGGEQSDVVLNSAIATSNDKVKLTFSGNINSSTMTPLNLSVNYNDASWKELSISNIKQLSSNEFELNTEVQKSDTNYFITFNGVLDARGLPLRNSSVKNFFGFEVPTVSVISAIPSSIVNDEEHEVVLSGSNLNTVNKVLLNDQEVEIKTPAQNDTDSLIILIPAELDAGAYDLNIINESNESIKVAQILISDPVYEMQVDIAGSYTIPSAVKPGDEVTFKLKILDPSNSGENKTITINLGPVQGTNMVMKKDTDTYASGVQFYTLTTTIPETAYTNADPYMLTVNVKRIGKDDIEAEFPLKVTNDLKTGAVPIITKLSISPNPVSFDGESEIVISARVQDMDGIGTIDQVVADFPGELGLTPVILNRIGSLESAGEKTEDYFISDAIELTSKNVADGSYNVEVTAYDTDGDSGTLSSALVVSSMQTGPTIDPVKTYLSRKSVPNDGKTVFAIHAYVSDPDSVADIEAVTADFGMLGLAPVSLIKGSDTSDKSKGARFSAEGLTVPRTSPIGVHTIEITAEDETGIVTLSLQIDITNKDTLGEPPRVYEDRGYTTPRVAINDGQTPITLYAFVRDDDDDIDSVIVNLSSVGQLGMLTSDEFGTEPSALTPGDTCSTGSNTMVCMTPSVKEGNEGQWFVLSDIIINKTTTPASEPYLIPIIVSDKSGKIARSTIAVSVYDGNGFTNDKNPPSVSLVTSTSVNTIEVLFSEELSAMSVTSNGNGFEIVDRGNINNTLNIIAATISADGKVVTLTTDDQEKDKNYVLSATNSIQDAVGVPLVQGSTNRVEFTGFASSNKAPNALYVAPIDSNTVEIEFQGNLKPSTISKNSIKIYESDNTLSTLRVTGVEFVERASTVYVKTENQKSDVTYRINIEDIESYDGVKRRNPINKMFKGFKIATVQKQRLAGGADLNGDGKVDFIDFTMFSAVYGTTYGIDSNSDSDSSSNSDVTGQPIQDTPDSTVPHTSSIPN